MKLLKKSLTLLLILGLLVCSACSSPAGGTSAAKSSQASDRTIKDSMGREVKVPAKVESIVCVGVGALRYSVYVGAANLAVGVEDYETKPGMSRLYNYVNFDKFKDLPITGKNGEPNTEEIIKVNPQVIVMSKYASCDAEELSKKTGIPVVVVPGSDTTLDEGAYETIQILGELYSMEDRAKELTDYLKGIQADLEKRTKDISDDKKPSVYVGGVSFKGQHGFEGTESHYGPFELIHAKNVADSPEQSTAYNVDLEKVMEWDPDIIFLDFNGMDLIKKDYDQRPDYYKGLKAVKNNKVYSQISFRSSASNLETALADSYYAASIIFPEQFKDVDPIAKTGEIFNKLLGSNPYDKLKESGYEFRSITIGQ